MRSLAILAPMLLAIGVATWGVGRATALLAPGIVESLQSLWKQTAPTGGTMFALAVATIATWLAAAAIPLTRPTALRVALGAAYRLAYLGLALPALASREVFARVYAKRGRLK